MPTKAGRRPELDALEGELDEVLAGGFPGSNSIALSALRGIAAMTGDDATPNGLESLLRKAVDRLGGGPWADAAAAALGVAQGTRGLKETVRRRMAAELLDIEPRTFQRTRRKAVISDVAKALIDLAADGELRHAHARMSRREPAESRLAVQWVERFEAYNRLWTPAYALGADLTAYRSTLLEADRPYDREPGTDGPDDPGDTQEHQAEGYARFALFRFAEYMWQLRQFMTRHGGMWLFSSQDAETRVTDAVYRIHWHVTPFNERDESWLRAAMQDARGQEMHTFLNLLGSSSIGRDTHDEWQEWVASCACTFAEPDGTDTGDSYFPTRKTDDGVDDVCQVHRVIEACGEYCDLVDRDWAQIADWYHLGEVRRRGVNPGGLYQEWRTHAG